MSPPVRPLKTLLLLNGLVFLLRGFLNVVRPTSFYLEPSAPKSAVGAVRVLGVTYGALGVVQLGMWRVADRSAVRVVSVASLLFAAGVAVLAPARRSASAEAFHRMWLASAIENAAVAAAYGALLCRERRAPGA